MLVLDHSSRMVFVLTHDLHLYLVILVVVLNKMFTNSITNMAAIMAVILKILLVKLNILGSYIPVYVFTLKSINCLQT